MKKAIFSISFAGIWITISEFVRNEFLFKDYWINHYNSIGLKFETYPINGIVWMFWSFSLAFQIYKLLEKYSIRDTIIISWLTAFFMMWLTLFNLQTLPLGLLLYAIPLSLLEVWVSVWIIKIVLK